MKHHSAHVIKNSLGIGRRILGRGFSALRTLDPVAIRCFFAFTFSHRDYPHLSRKVEVAAARDFLSRAHRVCGGNASHGGGEPAWRTPTYVAHRRDDNNRRARR